MPGQITGTATRDLEAFESGSKCLSLKAQPHIDAMAAHDAYQLNLLAKQFMEEKAGIGEATDLRRKNETR